MLKILLIQSHFWVSQDFLQTEGYNMTGVTDKKEMSLSLSFTKGIPPNIGSFLVFWLGINHSVLGDNFCIFFLLRCFIIPTRFCVNLNTRTDRYFSVPICLDVHLCYLEVCVHLSNHKMFSTLNSKC